MSPVTPKEKAQEQALREAKEKVAAAKARSREQAWLSGGREKAQRRMLAKQVTSLIHRTFLYEDRLLLLLSRKTALDLLAGSYVYSARSKIIDAHDVTEDLLAAHDAEHWSGNHLITRHGLIPRARALLALLHGGHTIRALVEGDWVRFRCECEGRHAKTSYSVPAVVLHDGVTQVYVYASRSFGPTVEHVMEIFGNRVQYPPTKYVARHMRDVLGRIGGVT